MENVKDVLGRWGKKVGEATRKAEDLAGNTWQHRKLFLYFNLFLEEIAQNAHFSLYILKSIQFKNFEQLF